jgi:hypothetical protein
VIATIQALREEVATLREENARLRLESQRALTPGRAATHIREITSSCEAHPQEMGDDAWQVLTDAHVLRSALLAVCRELHTSAGQLERALETGVPISELDRRVRSRAHLRSVPTPSQEPPDYPCAITPSR